MDSMAIRRLRVQSSPGKYVIALVDGDYDGEYFSQYKWYLGWDGYPFRDYSENGKRIRVKLHQEVSRTPRGLWTDHINRNKLDNRSCNLRWVTPRQNTFNRVVPKMGGLNTSRYRGVMRCSSKKKNGKTYIGNRWMARCNNITIGTYDSELAAAKAYNIEAKKLHGDIAVLNMI